MTATRTPGPWRIGDAGHTVFGPSNGQPSPETVANVRARTNARLIAAAPELLEAPRLLLDLTDSGEQPSDDLREHIVGIIAKAEGRTE